MISRIDAKMLQNVSRHYRKGGLKHLLKGLPYERCAELPFVIDRLASRFGECIDYLDIGSGGDSPLPTYLLGKTSWNICCIDKHPWVNRQQELARKTMRRRPYGGRLQIIHRDALRTDLPEESFDIITSISVVEHFGGDTDAELMRVSSQWLRPGGIYILTTLVNEGYFREHFVRREVYGSDYRGDPVFYQRHYDLKSLQTRVLEPSGLRERERIFFGDYEFQGFQTFFGCPPKCVRAFYHWAQPRIARTFLSYRDYPVSRKGMHVNTTSGVIVVLEK